MARKEYLQHMKKQTFSDAKDKHLTLLMDITVTQTNPLKQSYLNHTINQVLSKDIGIWHDSKEAASGSQHARNIVQSSASSLLCWPWILQCKLITTTIITETSCQYNVYLLD